MSRRIGRPGTDDCTFCGHPRGVHLAKGDRWTSCSAEVCEDPAENRGRCAVYTSEDESVRAERWFAAYGSPHNVNPADVATRIHRGTFGEGEHLLVHSCSCAHQAMALLGLDEAINAVG